MAKSGRFDRLRADLESGSTSAALVGERVCRASVDLLTVDGAGIMLVDDGGRLTTMGVSDVRITRLEDLQFVLGEGPGIEAHQTDRVAWEPDLELAARSRWPAYSPAATGEGVAAVFAFPLHVGGIRLGALTVYQRRRGPLHPDQTKGAIELAEVAADALLSLQAHLEAGGAPGGIDLAGGLRARVHQAAGMISEQLDIAIGDALARLRAYAYAAQRPIDDVARDVVGRRLWIDQPPE
jgi:hypothetical protein